MAKRIQKATASSVIATLQLNEDANSQKVSETGFSIAIYLGALNTAKQCGLNKPVLIANSDSVVHYVVFGATSAVVAPVGLATGIMIPPTSVVTLASGQLGWVIADSADVGGYVATEQILQDAPPQPAVFTTSVNTPQPIPQI